MNVVPAPVQYTSPLVNKYLGSYPEVSHLFEHNPADPASFGDRYEVVMRDYHTDRTELVRILSSYNEGLNCGRKTRENLEKLKNPGTVVIITGQQAGVFTGPLYTVYKTITVLQLAREVEEKTGIKAVPVFWVAAEDHDFAEVDHVELVDREQQPVRLKLEYDPGGRYPVGSLPVNDAVFNLISRLDSETNPSEWKSGLIEHLKALAAASDNLADWFAGIMSWLFRKHGLILVNPLNTDLKALLAGTFEEFLLSTKALNEKLQAGAAAVRALGAVPQVEKEVNNTNLFFYAEGQRYPLLKSGDDFTMRGREGHWTLEELRGVARNSPELLSPNVVLRPVAQDVLMPILAYVAGPGEIAYYSLFRPIYPLFNQRMPIIFPRANLTLVERGIAKNMEKYGVDFTQGLAGLRNRLAEYMKEQDRLGIDKLFGEYGGQLESSFRELVTRVSLADPELTKHGNESLNKILHQLEHFEKKTRQQHRKSCDMVVKRFNSMEIQLFPRNNWQERVFNVFPYLFKYGPGLIDQLAGLPLLGNFDHKLVYLGD